MCPDSEPNCEARRPVNHPYRPSRFRDLEKNLSAGSCEDARETGMEDDSFPVCSFNEAYQSPRLYIQVGIARKDYRGSSLENRGGHTWRP